MDSAGDSDHSLTWEDFFGSTTDLTPTLIGIYDSFLEDPTSPVDDQKNKENKSPKQTPPVPKRDENKRKMPPPVTSSPSKDPRLIAGGIKLPGFSKEEPTIAPPLIIQEKKQEVTKEKVSPSKSKTNYVSKLKSFAFKRNNSSEVLDVKTDNTKSEESPLQRRPSLSKEHSEVISKLNSEIVAKAGEAGRKTTTEKSANPFDNLSPTVKRMLNSATDDESATSSIVSLPKKPTSLSLVGRSSYRSKHSNIPLMGTTSKLTQASADIVPVTETVCVKPPEPKSNLVKINVRPTGTFVSPLKSSFINRVANDFSLPSPEKTPTGSENKVVYDVPVNSAAIYDVPKNVTPITIDKNCDVTVRSDKTPSPKRSIDPNLRHGKIFENVTVNEVSPAKIDNESRLNVPNEVQVPRPLSMSSIASSSSTSSSGAQNKNGVNSAYLASIESLDDHSDMDNGLAFIKNRGNGTTTQSNSTTVSSRNTDDGPVNIGVRTPTSPRPRYCDPSLSVLERVCTEIIDTENIYVEDLRQVVEGYLYTWRERDTFPADQLDKLFSNIEDIYHFNKMFLQQLNECNLEPVSIARCFVRHSGGFNIYSRYCTAYPGTMDALARMVASAETAHHFKTRQHALGHALPLGSYLLKPVQRILKYHLLLQNLVKQCTSHDTESALLKMTGIAQNINDMKRRHEHAVRVQEIQSLLYGWVGQDLTTYGELCAEGTFRVFGAKAMRHAFLFDKMLLLTKNKEYGILAYKSHIMCNNLMLVESISGQPLSFHVIPFDCPRMQVTLQARSIQHKREWTLLLKRVILENYNAVIPSHARQLVMELGQNKTDDDILAEKSGNLISHASMRKQMSAPEYLEKRKLEKERRKSYENNHRQRLKRSTAQHSDQMSVQAKQKLIHDEIGDQKHYICKKCKSCYICPNCSREDLEIFCNKCQSNVELFSNGNYIYDTDDQCNSGKRMFYSISDIHKQGSDNLDDSIQYIDEISSVENIDDSPPNKIIDKCNCDNSQSQDFDTSKPNRIIKKTCLKCHKIMENIVNDSNHQNNNNKVNHLVSDSKSKGVSKDDIQTLSVPKMTSMRRKSEPGMANINFDPSNWISSKNKAANNTDIPYPQIKVSSNSSGSRNDKLQVSCSNCGKIMYLHCKTISDSNDFNDKLNVAQRKSRSLDRENLNATRLFKPNLLKPNNIEIKMYNTKTVPKKISKIKKNKAKSLRYTTVDATAKFYTDFSNPDVLPENVLHISESTESINMDNGREIDPKVKADTDKVIIPNSTDFDEETYRSLIQKTDSFKKSELEKNKLKNVHIQSSIEDIQENENKTDTSLENEQANLNGEGELSESCEEYQTKNPLEEIISQLLMQNREFQKILKRHQQKNAASRRHQRLLKSHSNPEGILSPASKEIHQNIKPKYGRQTSAVDSVAQESNQQIEKNEIAIQGPPPLDEHIYETLKPQITDKTSDIQNDLNNSESDYVYLCFDGKRNISAYKIPKDLESNNEYAIPVIRNSPQKSSIESTLEEKNNSDFNDSGSDIWKRISEEASKNISEIENMSKDAHAPQLWLDKQKEHFHVSQDKKADSLPRSFQVILNSSENTTTISSTQKTTFKKTYINKNGKVIQSDRPFTIASDQSDICYEDMERLIKSNENTILQFPTKSTDTNFSSISLTTNNDMDDLLSVSQSSLNTVEVIDQCFKNKFGNIYDDKLASISQTNTLCSSVEVIGEKGDDTTMSSIHPEHKIYKPNMNILSLKNILYKLKLKGSKSSNDTTDHMNAISNDSKKTSPKQNKTIRKMKNTVIENETVCEINPTNECLNKGNSNSIPIFITEVDSSSKATDLISNRSFSHTDNSQDQNYQTETLSKSCYNISNNASTDNLLKPHNFKHSDSQNDISKSVQNLPRNLLYKQGSKHLGARIAQSDYADPKLLLSGPLKSEMDKVNILINKNSVRPDSLISNSSHFTSSSEGNHYQQPSNKNTSFLYTSEKLKDSNHTVEAVNLNVTTESKTENTSDKIKNNIADESFYEKSFEEIENILDSEIFRDSAIYSDPEDSLSFVSNFATESSFKSNLGESSISCDHHSKALLVKNINITNKENGITYDLKERIEESSERKTTVESNSTNSNTTKLAPPIPMKPNFTKSLIKPSIVVANKVNLIKSPNVLIDDTLDSQEKSFSNSQSSKSEENLDQEMVLGKLNVNTKKTSSQISSLEKPVIGIPKPIFTANNSSNIQIKRLSFERCSLDPSKINKRSKSVYMQGTVDDDFENSDISKSVQEIKRDIETKSMSFQNDNIQKNIYNRNTVAFNRSVSLRVTNSNSSLAKDQKNPSVPTINSKPLGFRCQIPQLNSQSKEKSTSIPKKSENSLDRPSSNINHPTDQANKNSDTSKSGWVKHVVNKFQ